MAVVLPTPSQRSQQSDVIPQVLPIISPYGLMVFTCVSKTPTATIQVMSIARPMISNQGLQQWPSEIHAPTLLDNPSLGAINNLKSFMDVGEKCLAGVPGIGRLSLKGTSAFLPRPVTMPNFRTSWQSSRGLASFSRASMQSTFARRASTSSKAFSASTPTTSWLDDDNKKYYGMRKDGQNVKYPG